MRAFVIFLALSSLPFLLFGQKKLVQFSSSDYWPSVDNIIISNNGKYVFYQASSKLNKSELVIQDTAAFWKINIEGASNPVITNDNKSVCFKISPDSLGIINLESHLLEKTSGIANFKVLSRENAQWMACQLTNKKREVLLRNLSDGRKVLFSSIRSYIFNDQQESMLLQSEDTADKSPVYTLIWVRLQEGRSDTIWKGNNPAVNMIFDPSGKRLVFQSEVDVDGRKCFFLYYYQVGDEKVSSLVNNITAGMDSLDICMGNIAFSKNGKRLFFNVNRIKAKESIAPMPDSVKVKIWSYKDERLLSEQLHDLGKDSMLRVLKACIDLVNNNRKAIILERGDDRFIQLPYDGNGEYAIACNFKGNHAEHYWRTSARYSYYLISLKDGSRHLIQKEIQEGENIWSFSGSGKYLIWYGGQKGAFFTLNLATGNVRNISRKIKTPIFDDEDFGLQHLVTYPYGIAKWLEEDTAVLVYDKFDIWRLDPDGKRTPVNVTGGYGRKRGIVLRLSSVPAPNGSTLLEAFNDKNKSTGFFAITLNKDAIPHELTIGPFHPQKLIKAKFSDVYLINRSNEINFPNWFVTCNFFKFLPLTEYCPQKGFNWYETELMHWKMFDGRVGEGILYKPEDFNPKDKYPVIFLYYERGANQLHRFLFPGASEDEINIPWFVSRGYLVFVPDIYYKPGYPGRSAYNSVVSAAQYLSKISWVDSKHLGLQGHSFGGYETNYIVTQTNLFAAAVSAAGLSDLISYTFGVRGYTGESNQQITENSQMRIFATLWKQPELYIKNSPIFYVNRISTPMLIIHNEKDGAVPQSQSIELFTALRRLRKKAWMIQYEGEGHTIENEENKQDYSIRMEQFFSHYLKGDPAPKWMVEDIPVSKKRIDLDLQADLSGKQP